jgi:hypothetical protein
VRTLLLMTILSGVLFSPAFAEMSADDMSCADFTAMDSSGQLAAVDRMGGAMKSGDAGAMSSDAMSSDQKGAGEMASDRAPVTAESVAAACADHPDMTVHDAMKAH